MNSGTEDMETVGAEKPFRLLRLLRKIIIVVFVTTLLLIGAGAIIGYIYQDEVKEYIVGELNKNLNTEIIVDGKDINFTVIKSFPLAALEFKNVKALDATNHKIKDTLFNASLIAIQFNLFDIFHKKYSIKKLLLDDVTLKIRVDKNGNDNFHFWKELVREEKSENFRFELNEITLTNIRFSYINKKQQQKIDFLMLKSKLSGEFSSKEYTFYSNNDLEVNEVLFDNASFFKNKRVKAKINFGVDKNVGSYKFNNSTIRIENLAFALTGNILEANNTSILNINIEGKEMDIQSVLSIIPDKYKKNIADYKSDGMFFFKASIRGESSQTSHPHIEADFGIDKSTISETKNNIVLNNVCLQGRYTNGEMNAAKSSEISIKNLRANIGNGNVSADFNIKNFANPLLDGSFSASAALSDLQNFFKWDTLENVSGIIKTNFLLQGPLSKNEKGLYGNFTSSGNLQMQNVGGKFKNATFDYKNLNGDFIFDNNNIVVNNLTGTIASSDFRLEGSINNVFHYLFNDSETILIDAKLYANQINLNELLENKEERKNAASNYKLRFSENIAVNFSTEIGKIIFRKFEATNISGNVQLRNKKLSCDPLTLNTMDGKMRMSGLIDATDSTNILITCFSEINNVSIPKLFESFENFNQKNIIDKNLKGKASAKIQFAATMNEALKLNTDKLYTAADMTIENGELINVEALKKLSRFISLEELQNIRFETLRNTIEIKSKQVIIPKMEIKSNALNITLSGKHSFKNEIDYHIKLSLSQLLAAKAKKAKKENEEFGQIADDGLGRTNIFISMTGTTDKPIIKYDSKSAMDNVKQDIKVEKQVLKGILKEEFGWFKKDSSIQKKNKAEETKFKIEWDDAEKKEEAPKQIKRPKKQEEDDF